MASLKADKIIEAMDERSIAIFPYELDEGKTYASIGEYEAVTGQKFPYTQEDYERHCC